MSSPNKAAIFLYLFLFLVSRPSLAQDQLVKDLVSQYENFKEPSLNKRRIKHEDLQPLIEKYQNQAGITVTKVGESIEGRSLSLLSLGSGDTDVFLWSQMHGDEPTATQAIFDILNYFSSEQKNNAQKLLLKKLRFHFLPMLNPDGAEVFTRRNALGIDINRDALDLASPEGRTLKRVRDSLEADFGFNLHDQSKYYNAERTDKPATLSYLAPAYNYEKDINEVRGNAMKVIVLMNALVQGFAPGQVGRYNDDFEPRAFGDNIQKWGTSAILIESGGFLNDAEKQEIRQLNYVSILAALYSIATKSYEKIDLDDYEKIPHNDRKLFDLKIEDVQYELLGNTYTLDIGVNYLEVDNASHSNFYTKAQIMDLGDLSTYYGYETFPANGYKIIPGKIYQPKDGVLPTKERAYELLKKGYVYWCGVLAMEDNGFNFPMQVVSKKFMLPDFRLYVGLNPSFLLSKNGVISHAVVNGYLIDLQKESSHFRNAIFLR